MKRRFAISDIHGCLKTFRALIESHLMLTLNDELYLLGDYIDRGPDSKGVLDYIIDMQEAGYYVKCLKGNHEAMILEALDEPMAEITWLINGGDSTLISFDLARLKDIPTKYLHFIEGMEYYVELEKLFLVHAGFNFSIPNPLEDKKAMLWSRDEYRDLSKINNKSVIHGHTPSYLQKIEENLAKLGPKEVSIDNGCCYYDPYIYGSAGEKSFHNFQESHSLGGLCALDLDSFHLYHVPNIE